MRLIPVAGPLLLLCLYELALAQGGPSPTGSGQPFQIAPSSETSSVAPGPFSGGVPSGKASSEVLRLTLKEAVDRGLRQNLGLLLSDQAARAERGTRWRALSDLLPQVSANVSETRQELSTAALGISDLPGLPPVIGPFNVFDARLFLSQSILDFHAIYNARAESANLKGAEYSYRDARDTVTLVVAGLYLQAVAGASRVEAARAQVKTSEALYNQAVDLKKAGIIPGIDLLRSQVELETQRQRLIFLENEFEKQKLGLARVIGLPIGQPFILADPIPHGPLPAVGLDEALARAYRSRSDFQRAIVLAQGAALAKKAAQGEAFPSLRFNGDYGDIGLTPSDSRATYSVRVELQFPLFEGGRARGRVLEADALLRRRQAEMEDLRGRIDYEVRTALLDLKSSNDRARVAKSALDLADEQLKQAEDRFSAGVATGVEVTQAQDAVAVADENDISSLYALNIAKASLARAMGIGEEEIVDFLNGK